MVKSLQREPEDDGQPQQRVTHCVVIQFSIVGTPEEGKRVQDALGTHAADLLRDVVLVMLGRDKVPSTHVKVNGFRKRRWFEKLLP